MSNKLSKLEKDFIDKIKDALEKKGWKPIDLARALGFSSGWASNIMRYQRGKQSLTIKLLYDIADKLDVDPVSLLPNIKNPKTRISFEDHIWHIIEERLDEYIDKKIEEKLKPKK